jgi:hypothetical protein
MRGATSLLLIAFRGVVLLPEPYMFPFVVRDKGRCIVHLPCCVQVLRRCVLQCIMFKSVLYHPLSSKVAQASYSQQAVMWLVTSSTRQSVSFLTSFRFHQLRVVCTIISRPPLHHPPTLHSEQLDLPFILLLIQG